MKKNQSSQSLTWSKFKFATLNLFVALALLFSTSCQKDKELPESITEISDQTSSSNAAVKAMQDYLLTNKVAAVVESVKSKDGKNFYKNGPGEYSDNTIIDLYLTEAAVNHVYANLDSKLPRYREVKYTNSVNLTASGIFEFLSKNKLMQTIANQIQKTLLPGDKIMVVDLELGTVNQGSLGGKVQILTTIKIKFGNNPASPASMCDPASPGISNGEDYCTYLCERYHDEATDRMNEYLDFCKNIAGTDPYPSQFIFVKSFNWTPRNLGTLQGDFTGIQMYDDGVLFNLQKLQTNPTDPIITSPNFYFMGDGIYDFTRAYQNEVDFFGWQLEQMIHQYLPGPELVSVSGFLIKDHITANKRSAVALNQFYYWSCLSTYVSNVRIIPGIVDGDANE